MTVSSGFDLDNMAGELESSLLCCCTEHTLLSQALPFIK